jgi:MFS superfamily sulfate permease-like transporter
MLHLLVHWRTALVLLATFMLTVVRDLATGIAAGCAIAALLYLWDRFTKRQAA